MKVNIISESQWFPKQLGGMHTAFLTNLQILRRENIFVYVNSLRRSDITHIHSFNLFALFKLLTSKNTIVTTHMLPETLIGTVKGEKYWLGFLRNYMKFFYNQADLVIALSSYTRHYLKDLGVNSNITIISNPIDRNTFYLNKKNRYITRRKYKIKENAFVVTCTGHFIPRKGTDDFITIAKKLPHITFVWVGGDLATMFNTKEKHNYSEKIPNNLIITGNVDYEEMPLYYNMADVFIFTSFQEVASMSILEAAACGLPLVLRNLEQYQSLYGNNYIACEDTGDFVKELIRLSKDKKYFQTMQAKSLEIAKEYTFEKIGGALLKEYEKLLG